MATQFIIDDSAIVKAHIEFTVDAVINYYGCFEVKIKTYGLALPKQLAELFDVNVGANQEGYGTINRRIYSKNLKKFLSSFYNYCNGNLTTKEVKNDCVVYTYHDINQLGVFEYDNYEENEFTIEFSDEEVIFYVDGKEIPDAFVQIQSSLYYNSIDNLPTNNSRIFVYSSTGYFNTKKLVKQIFQYLGQNSYQIVNIDQNLYSIDLRNDNSKAEIVEINKFVEFIDTIEFEVKPEDTLGDLMATLISIGDALPQIDVVKV